MSFATGCAAFLFLAASAALVSLPMNKEEQFNPEGLFLTWQRDPTTTMTIQWFEPGSPLPNPSGANSVMDSHNLPLMENSRKGDLSTQLDVDGFAVDFLAGAEHERYDPGEFSAVARLGWHTAGLLFHFRVQQADHLESGNPARLWNGASVEVIVSKKESPSQAVHLSIAPGLSGECIEPRIHLISLGEAVDGSCVEFESTEASGGYTITGILPWKFLAGYAGKEGDQLMVQLYVNNRDARTTRRLAWYPSNYSGVDGRFAHRVALGHTASPAYTMTGITKRLPDALACRIYALPELAGSLVRVSAGAKVECMGQFELVPGQHYATVDLTLPHPDPGFGPGVLDILLEGERRLQLVPGAHVEDYLPPPSVELKIEERDSPSDVVRKVSTEVLALSCRPGIFLHRVEVHGLKPDHIYQFGREDRSGTFSFQTMPATLNRPLTFAIGGDNRHKQEWMEQTNLAVMKDEPAFVVWGGDLADANGQRELIIRWEEWFDAIKNTLIAENGRVTPIIVGIGNHDVVKGYAAKHEGYEPTNAWRARIAPEFYEFFPFPGQPGYGVLDFGNYLSLVLLDSAHTNPVEGAQTQWLDSVLRQRQQVPHVLPVYHVPAFPSVKSYSGVEEAAVRTHWTPLFDKYKIRSAFEHHNHAYKRTHPIKGEKLDPAGTVYFGDGAWGVNVRPVHDPETTWYLAQALSERHAIMVTLDGTTQSIRVISAQGEQIDSYFISNSKSDTE